MQRYCKLGEMQNKLELFLILGKKKEISMVEISFFQLGYPDSNQERQDQNLQCYHYTIPQCLFARELISQLRVQRYYFFPNYQNFCRKKYKKPQFFRFYFAFHLICSTFVTKYTYYIINGTNKTAR